MYDYLLGKRGRGWDLFISCSVILTQLKQEVCQYAGTTQTWLYIRLTWQNFRNPNLRPTSKKCDLIDLESGPDVRIFESSLGDSNVQPGLRPEGKKEW